MSRRRRSIPWIYRWSRPLIAAIAGCGALTTAYLTVIKLTRGTAACPTSGCDQVLASDYATVFGLPLTLFGFLAYTSMVIFALAPLAVDSAKNKAIRSNLENWTWLLLLAGAIAMTVFSGYLMYLLAFQIKAVCLYCLASAAFSLSLLVLTIVGRTSEDVGQVMFTVIVVGMVTLIGTLGIYPPNPITSIQSTSGAAEIALVQHLNRVGAKMYGAYTCPHCQNQKHLFGKEAASLLNYIECHPEGKNARPDLCQAARIQGFPTWEIKGRFYQGEQSLEKLAELSGFQGPRNFQQTIPGL